MMIFPEPAGTIPDEISDPRRRLDDAEESIREIRTGEADGGFVTAEASERLHPLRDSQPMARCGRGARPTSASRPSAGIRHLDPDSRLDADPISRSSEESRIRHDLRILVEETPDPIFRFARDRRIEYANAAASRVIRLPLDDITGRRLTELPLPRRLIENVEAALEVVFEEVREARVEVNAGRGLWFEVRLWPGLDARGNAIDALAVARDVTAQHRAASDRAEFRRQIEQSQRVASLGRLSATVAHEFNNVLMSMQPFAEMLARQFTDTSAEHRYAAVILQAIERGRQTTQEILRFTSAAPPNLAPLAAAPWLDDFRTTLQGIVGEAISLTIAVSDEEIHLLADRLQLEQLLTNLALNARDAMRGRGELTIDVSVPKASESFSFGVISQPSRFVHFAVSDNGPGIARHVLPNVFDPLFTTKREGTGLGLAVARQIVTGHEGSIFVESQPGRTTFHIFLPGTRQTAAEADAQPAEAILTEASSSKIPDWVKTIAIIEDDPLILNGISTLLEVEGISVAATSEAQEALPLIDGHAPDIVILDAGLPDTEAMVLSRAIRERWPALGILFSTGEGEIGRGNAARPGRSEILRKPYSLAQLVRALQTLGPPQ
jgi:PAS domain S-box-containing protein